MRSIGLPELLVLVGVFVIIPLVALIVVYLVRLLQTRERLSAIEKGVPVPLPSGDPWERAARTRRWGILFIAAGLGMLIFFATGLIESGQRESAIRGMAFTAIPILLGVGLLYDYRLRARDLAHRRDM